MSKSGELDNYKLKIMEIAGRAGIITGIHNYCDRWCERCAFVSHCSVGIAEFETDGPRRDMLNKEFREHLSMVFQANYELIAESAREMGIDLDEAVNEYVKKTVYQEIGNFKADQ